MMRWIRNFREGFRSGYQRALSEERSRKTERVKGHSARGWLLTHCNRVRDRIKDCAFVERFRRRRDRTKDWVIRVD